MYAEFAAPLDVGGALFGGTIAALHEIAPADDFEIELHDPVLNRRIHHRYHITTLSVNA